jgi:hypothetical protein
MHNNHCHRLTAHLKFIIIIIIIIIIIKTNHQNFYSRRQFLGPDFKSMAF